MHDDPFELAAIRARRFADVTEGYETDGPDATIPGASKVAYLIYNGKIVPRTHPRYALIIESTRGHGYFTSLGDDLRAIEQMAAANIDDGWQPVCYFDLDELAGEKPPIEAGDMVLDDQGIWTIVESTDTKDGRRTLNLPGDSGDAWMYEDEVDENGGVHRKEPDTRMPKRYAVAKVVTTVAFNTIPTEN